MRSMVPWRRASSGGTVAFGLAVCLLAAGGAASARKAPEVLWTTRFGSPGDDNALEIFRHSTGIYVIGRVDGVMPGQTRVGGHDVYVRRMDHAGKEIWTRQFGTEGRETNMGIFVHDTGVYTAGGVGGALPGQAFAGPPVDVFVRKLDFDGNVVWTRQFGTGGFDSAHGIFVRTHGPGDVRVYVVGSAGPLPGQSYAGGPTDAFLRAYDDDGTPVWTRQFGSSASDFAWDVSVHETGIYVAGFAKAAVSGQTYAGGPSDVVVRKYDFDGNEAWTRQFGTEGDDTAQTGGVAADDTGVYVSGSTDGALPGQSKAGDSDAFVRKYDFDGNARWTRQYGTPGYDDAHGIAVFDGAAYVVGNTYGALPGVTKQTHAGDGDAYIRRYDGEGTETWTLQTGTAGFEEFFGVFADETGVYVVGFEGPAGDPPGPNDIFVARIGHGRPDGPRPRRRGRVRTPLPPPR
jgi:hypothetical protein